MKASKEAGDDGAARSQLAARAPCTVPKMDCTALDSRLSSGTPWSPQTLHPIAVRRFMSHWEATLDILVHKCHNEIANISVEAHLSKHNDVG